MKFLLLLSLFTGASAAYALDFSDAATYNDFAVIKNQKQYLSVTIRVYSPTDGGQFDPNACQNLKNAHQAGITIDTYMMPNATSRKTAAQQVQEVKDGLSRCNPPVVDQIPWLWVVNPSTWSTSITNNRNFIQQITTYFAPRFAVNIYTSAYDWKAITGDWYSTEIRPGQPELWYYNVTGPGVAGESSPEFSDFVPFGGWSKPLMKQFAQRESLPNIAVNPLNRNFYKITI